MRRLGFLVILLLVLAVAADRIVWYVARGQIATAVQRENRLAEAPKVSIGGFPLLNQAVDGRYEQVTVNVTDLAIEGGATLDAADVNLKGVHLPLRELTAGGLDQVPVEEADVRGRIGYASLSTVVNQQIGNQDVDVKLAAGSQADTIAVTGSFTSTLFSGQLAGEARATLDGDSVRVAVLPESLTGIPQPFRTTVADLLGVTFDIPALPFGLQPTGLTVTPDGVEFSAAGQDVVLDEDPPAAA